MTYVANSVIYFSLKEDVYHCGLDEMEDGHRLTCDFEDRDFMVVAKHTMTHHDEQRRRLKLYEADYQDRKEHPEKYADEKPTLGSGQL